MQKLLSAAILVLSMMQLVAGRSQFGGDFSSPESSGSSDYSGTDSLSEPAEVFEETPVYDDAGSFVGPETSFSSDYSGTDSLSEPAEVFEETPVYDDAGSFVGPETSFSSDYSGTDSLSEPSETFEETPVYEDAGTFVSAGEVPVFTRTCDENCGTEYFPICGSDGQTYNNFCYLNAAICRDPLLAKSSDGEC
ncbi:hypothetical protein SK128_002935 [Halocaridina rubra]|uniref:Kazal-like domain-containing protein n=1 Tax=Halocaridina rubra TaxID=373956 RepID=A0AAN9ADQ2_HALRR